MRKNIPKLSVLIPSYQSDEKLFRALESVRDQDFDNFEIVICDDGSEQFDYDHIKSFAANRVVKLLRHKTNLGTVRNLNDGLGLCEGEWVLIMAADDALVGRDILSESMEQAAKSEKEWLVGFAQMCDNDLWPSGLMTPSKMQMALLREGAVPLIWDCLCRDCFIPSGGTIYRRELLLRFGGFDPHYRLVEDWPLFLKLVRTGVLPEVMERPVILHRSSGVSQRAAGRNQDYQRDLIETMRREILPHLEMLPLQKRKEIETLCQDKKEIYQLRLETTGIKAKIGWFLTHPGTILRKITRRDVSRKV